MLTSIVKLCRQPKLVKSGQSWLFEFQGFESPCRVAAVWQRAFRKTGTRLALRSCQVRSEKFDQRVWARSRKASRSSRKRSLVAVFIRRKSFTSDETKQTLPKLPRCRNSQRQPRERSQVRPSRLKPLHVSAKASLDCPAKSYLSKYTGLA